MGPYTVQRFSSSASGRLVALKLNPEDNSILWRHILESFGNVAKVSVNGMDIHFMTDKNFEDLLPLRIEAHPNSIINVILTTKLTEENNLMAADPPPKYNEDHKHTEKIQSMVIPFENFINQPGDEYVRFRSRIGFQHVHTGVYLHSADWRYKTQASDGYSKQHAVQGVRSGEPRLEDFWQVVPADGSVDEINEKIGETIRYGTRVRLFSVGNKRWLHSHTEKSPVSNHKEVTTFGSESQSNVDDIWIVERFENGTEFWKSSNIFLLRHENSDNYLHTHPIIYMGENEVTCLHGNWYVNNLWRAVFAAPLLNK
ncbi:hypothetical protein BGZ76_002318 [Entomortierella beljakovae]|nr:hypothetical protein BGZ76_002318 [Entomortierella beljakovae]